MSYIAPELIEETKNGVITAPIIIPDSTFTKSGDSIQTDLDLEIDYDIDTSVEYEPATDTIRVKAKLRSLNDDPKTLEGLGKIRDQMNNVKSGHVVTLKPELAKEIEKSIKEAYKEYSFEKREQKRHDELSARGEDYF